MSSAQTLSKIKSRKFEATPETNPLAAGLPALLSVAALMFI